MPENGFSGQVIEVRACPVETSNSRGGNESGHTCGPNLLCVTIDVGFNDPPGRIGTCAIQQVELPFITRRVHGNPDIRKE
ncbi:MAG TPA: hypothetical protein VMO47_14440 [Rhodothermales bacterium]|nr:hypothetical protein [Rhodothermales bacterium]